MVSLAASTRPTPGLLSKVSATLSASAAPPCSTRLPLRSRTGPLKLLAPLSVTRPPVMSRPWAPSASPTGAATVSPAPLTCSRANPRKTRLPVAASVALPAVLAIMPVDTVTALPTLTPLSSCKRPAPTSSPPLPVLAATPSSTSVPAATAVAPACAALAPVNVKLPAPCLTSPPTPTRAPPNVVLLPLPPTVNVALPSVTLPDPDSEPSVVSAPRVKLLPGAKSSAGCPTTCIGLVVTSVPPVSNRLGVSSEPPAPRVSVPLVSVAETLALVAALIAELPPLVSSAVRRPALTVPPASVAELVAVNTPLPLSVPDRFRLPTVWFAATLSVAPVATASAALAFSCNAAWASKLPAATVMLGVLSEPPAASVRLPPLTVAEPLALAAALIVVLPLLVSTAVLRPVLTVAPASVAELLAVKLPVPPNVPCKPTVSKVWLPVKSTLAPALTVSAVPAAMRWAWLVASTPADTAVPPA